MQSQLSIPKDFFASFTLYNDLCNGSGQKIMMNLSRHKTLQFYFGMVIFFTFYAVF